MVACYPGPHAPHDFTSFLQPLEMELIELFNGIPIQNSLDKSHKILKAYVFNCTNLILTITISTSLRE